MASENSPSSDPKDTLKLKLTELEVSQEQPWGDDALNRRQVAERLTYVFRNQSSPLTISIHGHWGTGKTFLLRRWQKDLESQGFHAVYFNAWEDDFCDDPLLAILGQLSEYFQEDDLRSIAERVARVALPLLKRNLFNLLERHTGLVLELKEQDQEPPGLLEGYTFQRATKDDLKGQLIAMASKVFEATGRPLVFIIDELDRCRPTFAVELLERIKHIFDVPYMVFVLGINRDELCSSLKSVYGEINADVYLRRFFDFEFNLPEADIEAFARHLMQEYQFEEHYRLVSASAGSNTRQRDYEVVFRFLPSIWSRFGLSLRDADYCVRLLSLVCRGLPPRGLMYPWLLGVLIALKLKNPPLYLSFIQRRVYSSEVMDYIDEVLGSEGTVGQSRDRLDMIEGYLYLDNRRGERPTVKSQLDLVAQSQPPTAPEFISERTRNSSPQRIQGLLEIWTALDRFEVSDDFVDYLGGLIDLHQAMLRR